MAGGVAGGLGSTERKEMSQTTLDQIWQRYKQRGNTSYDYHTNIHRRPKLLVLDQPTYRELQKNLRDLFDDLGLLPDGYTEKGEFLKRWEKRVFGLEIREVHFVDGFEVY